MCRLYTIDILCPKWTPSISKKRKNLIPKFFGVKYHCGWWTKCPIPMLLLHTFSMRGDYVVGDEKVKTTLIVNQDYYQNSQGGLRENRH